MTSAARGSSRPARSRAAPLLSESVGANYIERNWPPALKESGAWSLKGLRQSFLNGALTRLPDPDAILRRKVVEFVEKGDFGLASGQNPDGTYQWLRFAEPVGADEVSFEADVYLLTKAKAQALKAPPATTAELTSESTSGQKTGEEGQFTEMAEISTVEGGEGQQESPPPSVRLRLAGTIPGEVWNRLGTRLLPKLRSGEDLRLGIEFSVTVKPEVAASLEAELRQALDDLGLRDRVKVERG
jgi:hypothetical protein